MVTVCPARALGACAFLAAVAALAAGGCAGAHTAERSTLETAGVGLEVDPQGPWHVTSSEIAPAQPTAEPAREPARSRDAVLARTETVPARSLVVAPPAPPPLPVPAARGAAKSTPKSAAPAKSPEAAAREKFLDHPTEVRGESLSLVLPARLAAEARLTGASLEEPTPGRRVASGGARLTCRELTLVGERITVRTREAGSEDVQITARGGAALVSRQGDQVLREEGAKTLIITNDRVTPLR